MLKKSKIKFVNWFTNFMNSLYYAIDYPNFQLNLYNLFQLTYYSIIFAVFPKISNFERKKNDKSSLAIK